MGSEKKDPSGILSQLTNEGEGVVVGSVGGSVDVVGSVDVDDEEVGSVGGSVDVVGSVDVDDEEVGSVGGSVDVVGSVDVDDEEVGSVGGSVDVIGSVDGSVDVVGSVVESVGGDAVAKQLQGGHLPTIHTPEAVSYFSP